MQRLICEQYSEHFTLSVGGEDMAQDCCSMSKGCVFNQILASFSTFNYSVPHFSTRRPGCRVLLGVRSKNLEAHELAILQVSLAAVDHLWPGLKIGR